MGWGARDSLSLSLSFSLSLSLFASGGPCQGGRLRAERSSLSLSLSADCPSGQDPPEADRKDASGGPCQGGRLRA